VNYEYYELMTSFIIFADDDSLKIKRGVWGKSAAQSSFGLEINIEQHGQMHTCQGSELW
jgi:hypothetical protein